MKNSSDGVPTSVDTERRAFVYNHIVSFEETNVVGNVYFARHLSWQGRCRELFLNQYAPGIVSDISRDLRLVTLRTSCEYFSELRAFDEITIQMRLAFVRQHRIGLDFDYLVGRPVSQKLAARGFQEIACMRVEGQTLTAMDLPLELDGALRPFGNF